MSGVTKFFIFISWLVLVPTASLIAAEEQAAKVEKKPELPATKESAAVDPDDAEAAEEADAAKAAMAMPVSPELVRVYGWREDIEVKGFPHKLEAKLDSGALTSSIHAEQKEYFERDGKKWIRFLVKDIRKGKKISGRIEAPMVRMAKIKEPGGASMSREVVLLSFRLGDRKFRGEFTLNNRGNMISPVLIGRSIIRDLGWVDVSRTHLAEQNILR
ncbi:MAG: ATP-dependent zinc protease [Luteolibacter sp.]